MINSRPAIILLAEDDRGDQILTQRAFEEGRIKNELHIVEDGEAALDYLFRRGEYEDPKKSPWPDILLLDLNLPKIDGRQVLEKLKEHEKYTNIVTIVLTTSKQEEDILKTYNLGIKSFITKPIALDDFIKTVQMLGQYWLQIVVLPPREKIEQ